MIKDKEELLNNTKQEIKKAFQDIEFLSWNHTYLHKPTQKYLPSVSKKYKEFEVPFDPSIAKFIAPKMGLTEAELLDQWKEKGKLSAERGTRIHKYSEDWYINNSLKPSCEGEKGVIEFFKDHPNYIVIDQEIILFNNIYNYAGTMDLLLYDIDTEDFIVMDWKGLPLDTPILTNNGWKIMDTLNLEDKVFDKNGKLCKIKNISSIHNKKCLKIIFDNNEEIVSDFEHRWLVDIYNKEKVLTTQELKDYWDNKKEKYKNKRISSCYHIKIPNAKPLDCLKKELSIDPYVLGMWLGDGHKADGKITQMNPLVWDEIKKRGYNLGGDVSGNSSGKAQTKSVFGLHKELKKLNLIFNKHVPDIFLLSSYEQRLDLLRGLMDADGYYNKIRKRFEMSTTRLSQAEYTAKILGTLGIKSTIIKSKKYLNGKEFQVYTTNFSTLINPFLCRNQDINIIKNNQHTYRRIIDIVETEQIPTKCIEVDSPTHTYLFGHTLTPTHNTNHDLFKNYKNKKLLEPFTDYLQNPLNLYKIQLNLYDMCLEEKGFDIDKRIIIWLKECEVTNKKYQLFEVEDLKPRLKKYYGSNS